MTQGGENEILAYYQAIESRAVTVGKWIQKLYTIIVDGLESKRWFFDQRKANNATRFIERYCRHNKGPLAPNHLELSLWEKALMSLIFGVVDAEGKRQFTEVFIVVGRKMGKTLIAAGVTTYIAYAVGEFGSEIYFLAPKLEQADLCFSAFEFNVDHDPALKKRTRSTKTRGLFIKESNTTVKKLPFSDKKSDGYNPMLFIADEVSSWQAARGLKQWEVMVSGTGAREEPLGLAISSAGYENDGVYDELFKRGTAFLNGNSREEHLLPVLYMIDDVEKWDDINELRKSLPGLGESVSVKFILKEIDTAYTSLSKRTEFLTKYCNIKQNSAAAWLEAQAVKKAFPPNEFELEDFRGCYALGGIDLSMSTDLTAAVVLIERGGICYFFTRFFLPAEKIQEATARDGLPYEAYIKRGILTVSGENYVDYHDVYNWFVELLEEKQIYTLMIGYDKYSAQYLVQDLEAYGFHTEPVGQGYNLTGVFNEMEGMIKDGKLQCATNNDLMKIHMLDSAMKIEAERNRRMLIKISKNAHIDGMAALSDAMLSRHLHYEEMPQLKNEGGEHDGPF